MYTIAHNVSVDYFRKNKQNHNTDEIQESDLRHLSQVNDPIKDNDETQQLSQALQLLRNEEREIFIRCSMGSSLIQSNRQPP